MSIIQFMNSLTYISGRQTFCDAQCEVKIDMYSGYYFLKRTPSILLIGESAFLTFWNGLNILFHLLQRENESKSFSR